jgi:hypothetical protein
LDMWTSQLVGLLTYELVESPDLLRGPAARILFFGR